MNIPDDAFVLEVGGGNNPNPRSDILVDRYLYDNHERAGGFKIVVDRPMVVADGYRLPFADKAFDYVICSHILEHMENPKAFLAEVSRVGKAGFIEVPSALSERVFGWDFHHWYCEKKGKSLVLRRKKEGERFGGFFHRLIARQIWFRRFFEEHEEKWYVRLEWKDHVNCIVVDEPHINDQKRSLDRKAWTLLQSARPEFLKDIQFYVRWMRRRVIRKLKKELRLLCWKWHCIVRRNRVIDDLLRVIICPSCRRSLTKTTTRLSCSNCHADYPLDGVIPVLLLAKERRKGY